MCHLAYYKGKRGKAPKAPQRLWSDRLEGTATKRRLRHACWVGRPGFPSEHVKYERLMRPQKGHAGGTVGPGVWGSGKLLGLGRSFGTHQHTEGKKHSKIPEVATGGPEEAQRRRAGVLKRGRWEAAVRQQDGSRGRVISRSSSTSRAEFCRGGRGSSKRKARAP